MSIAFKPKLNYPRHLEYRSVKGFVNHVMYRILMEASYGVIGDMIEFGVWRGATFNHVYKVSKDQNKRAHAVDSFIGLAQPDNESEARKFPKGAFNTGGPEWFIKKYPQAVVHAGFVPEVLSSIEEDVVFSFAHVDLDHERPTRQVLNWLWPKMSHRGILVCHDFYFDAKDCAPKAIEAWMKDNNLVYVMIADHSIVFRKGDS